MTSSRRHLYRDVSRDARRDDASSAVVVGAVGGRSGAAAAAQAAQLAERVTELSAHGAVDEEVERIAQQDEEIQQQRRHRRRLDADEPQFPGVVHESDATTSLCLDFRPFWINRRATQLHQCR